jgi:hypothetical protein
LSDETVTVGNLSLSVSTCFTMDLSQLPLWMLDCLPGGVRLFAHLSELLKRLKSASGVTEEASTGGAEAAPAQESSQSVDNMLKQGLYRAMGLLFRAVRCLINASAF